MLNKLNKNYNCNIWLVFLFIFIFFLKAFIKYPFRLFVLLIFAFNFTQKHNKFGICFRAYLSKSLLFFISGAENYRFFRYRIIYLSNNHSSNTIFLSLSFSCSSSTFSIFIIGFSLFIIWILSKIILKYLKQYLKLSKKIYFCG